MGSAALFFCRRLEPHDVAIQVELEAISKALDERAQVRILDDLLAGETLAAVDNRPRHFVGFYDHGTVQ
jgi:hypothetical protein